MDASVFPAKERKTNGGKREREGGMKEGRVRYGGKKRREKDESSTRILLGIQFPLLLGYCDPFSND